MNKYRFSTLGKIKGILQDIIIFGTLGTVFLFIGSKVGYFKYVVWIPLMWIVYHVFCDVMYLCMTTFNTDDRGLTLINYPAVETKISWEDIEKVKITRRGAKIIMLTIFKKGWKERLILDTKIENYKELIETILTHVKDRIKA